MDELLVKQMPHSSEAEQAVLGSILIDSRCVPEIIGYLKPADFYLTVNREIFEVITSMFNYSQPIDAVTVLEQMRLAGIYKESSQNYLAELMNITPTVSNAMEYAAIVKDKALLRAIAETAADISAMVSSGEGSSEDVLEAAERRIYAIRQGKANGGLEPVSSIISNVYVHLGELAKSGGEIPGLSTGMGDLDNVIMGLNKSDLILLASRPGMGKTSIALNIALSVAKTNNVKVAIFSLEMSKEQLATRLLSSEAFVDSKKLLTGRLSQSDWKKIVTAASVISNTGIMIDDNSMLTVSDMNAQCRRIDNLGLVIIDYLQLMTSASAGDNAESRLQAVSNISRMLKIMAKELNVPVICLSQLSRASVQRTDKRPQLSDLRESGSLEQDADIVLGLYREDYFQKESENHNLAECIIMKNRHGETGSINLQWLPEYTTYVSVDKIHSEE
jgi:replicative DNA helicase